MKRIQGSFGVRDPEEEKRRVRESVLSNLVIFGLIVGVIRVGKYRKLQKSYIKCSNLNNYVLIIEYISFSSYNNKSTVKCAIITHN